MADTYEWQGASGKTYSYDIQDRGSPPSSGQTGNYIFAKLAGGVWNPIHVGQGDLRELHQAVLRDGCVQLKGATHFHFHVNKTKKDRVAEEQDLLEGNPMTLAPSGCNKK